MAKRVLNFSVMVGILLLLAGALINVKTCAILFSSDNRIETGTFRIAVYVLQAALVLLGLFFIFMRDSLNAARIKGVLKGISVSLVTVLLALACLEIFLRVFDPHPGAFSENFFLFEHHKTFGWQFIPNKSGRVVFRNEHDTVVNINSAGMRDREYTLEKPSGKRRIVVLGDSFVAGFEVDESQVFTEVMEDKTLRNGEILNFGVNGFGPVQEFLMLKERAIQYNPDVIIMVIYIRNDFDDILGTHDWLVQDFQRPKAELDKNGELVITNIPVPLPDEGKLAGLEAERKKIFRLTELHLFNFVCERLADKNRAVHMPPEVRLLKKERSEETNRSYLIMKKIIEKTGDLARKKNAEFIVVIAPTIVQVYQDRYWSRIKKTYNIKDAEYDLLLPNKFIKKTCADLDVRVLDLTPRLQLRASKGGELYYRNLQHWNKNGHKVVAEEIGEYLKDNKLAR